MRLIDADAFRQDWLENGGNEYVYDTNSFLESIDDTPSVDPVHAAGGCYCRECKYQSYDEEYSKCWCNRDLGCRAVRADGLGFCDQGEPREAQDND